MNRRAFLLASGVALSSSLGRPRGADATTARLVTLEELVGYSTFVVVGTAGERHAIWEDLPSGRRIVTYTRVFVERAIVGSPGTELGVRTLGGVVDKIGQSVAGEAQLATGSRSMLFLAKGSNALVVAGMAQGHFPVITDEKGVPRLTTSPDTGLLVARPGPTVSARERLSGATLDDAASAVALLGKGAK
jgi:hypothetical protein